MIVRKIHNHMDLANKIHIQSKQILTGSVKSLILHINESKESY